ncbi:hypothetical protein NA56DRAFT_536156, partial [Hyaloscypha hepaticicola]
ANATEVVSWVPNPTNRGTSNILQSCMITTSLCVWTALHLNLKEHDDPTFLRISHQTWRKAGWLMIGLLAPEMVVYTAYKLNRAYRWLFRRQGKERTSARGDLPIELEAAQNPNQTSATARHDKIPWSLAQGFHAQMGGFALDTIRAYPQLLPESSGYSFYRPLNISKEDLQDKSKASGLAKALVCLQASWFCVQCLVRVGQALPVTLLEINTFAHSICALLVYSLWWDKPLDVEKPTYLPVQGIHAVSKWSDIERHNYTRRFIEYLPVLISDLKNKVRITPVPPWIQFLFLFVAFIYGGLHSLAWNTMFPSQTQRLLWQISSSIIMGAGVPALICYFLSEV